MEMYFAGDGFPQSCAYIYIVKDITDYLVIWICGPERKNISSIKGGITL